MSNNKFLIINLVIGFAIVSLHFLFNIPLWMLFITFIPLSIIGMIVYTSLYNFRKELDFEAVDRVKMEERVKALEIESSRVIQLGFNKVDEFYLQLIPDSITYVFRHIEEPTYMCLYHMGPKIVPDVITLFNNEYGLTTNSLIDSGNIPRGDKELLQIIENASYERLFDEHRKSVKFLEEKNLSPIDISQSAFREEFMKSLKSTGERITSYPAWPALLLFWVVSARGKIHARPIEQQCEAGMIKNL